MYHDLQRAISDCREKIKRLTLKRRKKQNPSNVAKERDPRVGSRDAANESEGFAN